MYLFRLRATIWNKVIIIVIDATYLLTCLLAKRDRVTAGQHIQRLQ